MYTSYDQHHSSTVVLVVGMLTFGGMIGVGRLILWMLRIRPPAKWFMPLTAVAGVLGTSLLAQGVAIAGIANSTVCGYLWVVLALLGGYELIRLARECRPSVPEFTTYPFLALLVVANLCTLLVALAPSSKIDELHYHALMPIRILQDGHLHFYRQPWEGAILPQMHYQLAALFPLGIGVGDGPNVTSWCLGVVLQIVVGRSATSGGAPTWVGCVAALGAGCGLLPVVTHGTIGPHAFSHLASAALVLACIPGRLGRQLFPTAGGNRIAAVAVLAVGTAASKLTLIPIATVCLLVAMIDEWLISPPRPIQIVRWHGRILLPFVALYLPLCLIAYRESGSPFGFIFAGQFGPSVYDYAEVRASIQATKTRNTPELLSILSYFVMNYPLVVWTGALLLPFARGIGSFARFFAATLTVLQFAIILFIIQPDIRFVGGYHYAIFAALMANTSVVAMLDRRGIPWLIAITFTPWLVGMVIYCMPFSYTTLGLTTREQFVHRYTAFREDFLALDATLPPDAVLIVTGVRLNGASACRPVLYDCRDCLHGRRPFWFRVGDDLSTDYPKGYSIIECLYDNSEAVIVAFRRPGAENRTGRVRVYSLAPLVDK